MLSFYTPKKFSWEIVDLCIIFSRNLCRCDSIIAHPYLKYILPSMIDDMYTLIITHTHVSLPPTYHPHKHTCTQTATHTATYHITSDCIKASNAERPKNVCLCQFVRRENRNDHCQHGFHRCPLRHGISGQCRPAGRHAADGSMLQVCFLCSCYCRCCC